MDELLAFYEHLIKQAEDGQVLNHLTNLVQDAAVLTDAVKTVVNQAKARVNGESQSQ